MLNDLVMDFLEACFVVDACLWPKVVVFEVIARSTLCFFDASITWRGLFA